MHIFRDMSVWVIARHIALTGCKLECRKTGGGGHEHASRFRSKKQRKGSSSSWGYGCAKFLADTLYFSVLLPCTYRKMEKFLHIIFISLFTWNLLWLLYLYVLLLSTQKIVSILRLTWRINILPIEWLILELISIFRDKIYQNYIYTV